LAREAIIRDPAPASVLPELVWNKGIAALCDWRIPDEFPDGQRYVLRPVLAGANLTSHTPGDLIADTSPYREIREGDTVWVRLSWLRSFVRQVLPHLRRRIVLATGDSVIAVSKVPPDVVSALEHPNILHWFAQNCDRTGARTSPLPLGVDFHTLSERPYWGEPMASPVEQEQLILTLRRNLPPIRERIPLLYVDFAWKSLRYGGRRHLVSALRRKVHTFFQPRRLARSAMWMERGRFAFVVCPHGAGLDCHRTWEALALGHIALVPSSPLDPLYQGLPVIPVERWDTITQDDLLGWLDRCEHLTVNNPRLTSAWWTSRLQAAGVRR
jgi:hypothetical protein